MIVGRFVLAFALAFIAESMSEYLFAAGLKALEGKHPALAEAQPMRYVALAVGLLLTYSYSLDVIYEAFGYTANWPPMGLIITGLAIGRGSGFLHDFWKSYLQRPAAPPAGP